MASTTSYLGLTKPAAGEGYSLDVWNNNMQKIDDLACIAAAFGAAKHDLSETLVGCTGTIAQHLQYHIAGKLLVIEGRLVINNYVRTAANPGFKFTIPSSNTAKYSESLAYVGFSGRASEPVRFGEAMRCYMTAGSSTVNLDTTETFNNMSSDTRACFMISPFVIPLT